MTNRYASLGEEVASAAPMLWFMALSFDYEFLPNGIFDYIKDYTAIMYAWNTWHCKCGYCPPIGDSIRERWFDKMTAVKDESNWQSYRF
jgi:hypothetical protein